MDEKKVMKIQFIYEFTECDKLAKEALEIAKNFKILTYGEVMKILEPKLSALTIN